MSAVMKLNTQATLMNESSEGAFPYYDLADLDLDASWLNSRFVQASNDAAQLLQDFRSGGDKSNAAYEEIALLLGERRMSMISLQPDASNLSVLTDADLQMFSDLRPSLATSDPNMWLTIPLIAKIISDLNRQVDDVEDRDVSITLLKFQAPSVKNGAASYKAALDQESNHAWDIGFQGAGFGAERTLTMGCADEIFAVNGEYKRVFATLTVRLTKIGLYERGSRVGKTLGVEMVPIEPGVNPGMGAETLSRDELYRDLSMAVEDGRPWQFVGDTGTSVHSATRNLAVSTTQYVQVPMEAQGLTAKCKISVKRQRRTELTFNLPAGHNYQLMRTPDSAAYMFKVD